jgi:hypothetical protein
MDCLTSFRKSNKTKELMLDKKWLTLHPFDPTTVIPVIITNFVLFSHFKPGGAAAVKICNKKLLPKFEVTKRNFDKKETGQTFFIPLPM